MISSETPSLESVNVPEGGFRVIVADPPWTVKRGPHWNTCGTSRDLEYPTLTLDAISRMQVESLAADDSVLFLWTINAYLEQTYEIARRWGFEPKTLLTWAKKPRGLGLGGAFVQTSEHCLYCRRGSLKAKRRIDSTWWTWSRGRHSQKPEALQDLVESVFDGPYLELFARRVRPHWSAWGNEVLDVVTT